MSVNEKLHPIQEARLWASLRKLDRFENRTVLTIGKMRAAGTLFYLVLALKVISR